MPEARLSTIPLSLDSPVGEDEDSELGQYIEDESSPTPMQAAYQSLLKEKIEEVVPPPPPVEEIVETPPVKKPSRPKKTPPKSSAKSHGVFDVDFFEA